MKVQHYTDVKTEKVGDDAVGTMIRWLISGQDGANKFHMRMLELDPGGKTPHHAHDWEHEVYILSGAGSLVAEDTVHELKSGMFAFVDGGEVHHFANTGDGQFVFLCLIPSQEKCC